MSDDEAPTCPPWCRRDHTASDHPEDLRVHQGEPGFVALVLTDGRLSEKTKAPRDVVVVPAAVTGRPPWIRIDAEEAPTWGVSLTPGSARRLARALIAAADQLGAS